MDSQRTRTKEFVACGSILRSLHSMPAQKVFCCNPLKKTALEFQFQVIKDCKFFQFHCSLGVCSHSMKDLSAEYFKLNSYGFLFLVITVT